MQTVGIVSAGAIGSAVGAAYTAAPHTGSSPPSPAGARTAALAARAGLELEFVLEQLCGREDLNLQEPKPTGT